MTASWHSLYLSCADRDAAAAALQQTLTALQYTLYDPFGLIPGKAYPEAVRLFVAPPQDGWVRVLGQPDERLLPNLSRLGACLWLALEGEDARIAVYVDGEATPPESALAAFLKDGATLDDLRHPLRKTHQPAQQQADDLPLDVLSQEMQNMAGQINLKRASKMFNRLSGGLLKKDEREKARALLSDSTIDWNSSGGQRLRALMACLNVPADWQTPDFVTLRDAYQLHIRRQRSPNAALYPGDAETMAQVPNALDYVPVYAGKS